MTPPPPLPTLFPRDLPHIDITDEIGQPLHYVPVPEALDALNAALLIGRPLLVWGEPGIGKSQLAKAAAAYLGRPFLSFVADADSEARDLLWHFDAVGRLAEAQRAHAIAADRASRRGGLRRSWRDDRLAIANFIAPGPLWWAFDWDGAAAAARRCRQPPPECGRADPNRGVVVLIDEIDKAPPSVPNGLLEALGAGCFQPQGSAAVRRVAERPAPLLIVTSNDEQPLPDAFQRRCLSLFLRFGQGAADERAYLLSRAERNRKFFPAAAAHFTTAADCLLAARAAAKRQQFYPLPGLAEYFDLLRGLQHQALHAPGSDLNAVINQMRDSVYRKHPGFHDPQTRAQPDAGAAA